MQSFELRQCWSVRSVRSVITDRLDARACGCMPVRRCAPQGTACPYHIASPESCRPSCLSIWDVRDTRFMFRAISFRPFQLATEHALDGPSRALCSASFWSKAPHHGLIRWSNGFLSRLFNRGFYHDKSGDPYPQLMYTGLWFDWTHVLPSYRLQRSTHHAYHFKYIVCPRIRFYPWVVSS